MYFKDSFRLYMGLKTLNTAKLVHLFTKYYVRQPYRETTSYKSSFYLFQSKLIKLPLIKLLKTKMVLLFYIRKDGSFISVRKNSWPSGEGSGNIHHSPRVFERRG